MSDQKDFIINSEQYLKNVAVDNIIFGYHNKELKVLLQRPAGFNKWTVTGGHIKKTESIEEAADRIAFMRTGLKNLFLQQFHSFGSPQRVEDNEFTAEWLGSRVGIDVPSDHWIFDYFVAIGFYTLTEFSLVCINRGPIEDTQWWPVSQLPALLFDHKEMIAEALKALRLHIYHYPVGYELLPEKFTLPEIHNLYETILDKSLDSRNFSRRLLATKIIRKLNETRSIGAHRSPFLYQFDRENYNTALKNGMLLGF
ncbi:MAG: NUDIX domain-containing protein [Ferruginibacter sp.]